MLWGGFVEDVGAWKVTAAISKPWATVTKLNEVMREGERCFRSMEPLSSRLPRKAKHIIGAKVRIDAVLKSRCLPATGTSIRHVEPLITRQYATLTESILDPKSSPQRERIVILGSGWGGYTLSRRLSPAKISPIVISPRSYFVFTPLLTDAAVGSLNFSEIVEPVRDRKSQVQYIQAAARRVDFSKKMVTVEASVVKSGVTESARVEQSERESDQGPEIGNLRGKENLRNWEAGQLFEVAYDKLVIAVGCVSRTFNTPGVRQNAMFFKDIGDARRVKRRIRECFELAVMPTTTPEMQKSLLHFAIVGGGPTGTELAAALSDFLHEDMFKIYPMLKERTRVTLYDVAPKVLSTFDKSLSEYAMKVMRREGVRIKTNHHIEELRWGEPYKERPPDMDPKGCLTLKTKEDGEEGVGLCVWATGNEMNKFVNESLGKLEQFPASSALIQAGPDSRNDVKPSTWKIKKVPKIGALLVNSHLRVQLESDDGRTAILQDVFALGDNCMLEHGSPPATAQATNQEASWLAKRLNKGDMDQDPGFSFKNLVRLDFGLQPLRQHKLYELSWISALGRLASMSAEPAFKDISRRKLAQLDSKIPKEWRLPAKWVPAGMYSPEESVTNTNYDAINVMDIPRECGLLSMRQLEITEKWDAKGLLEELTAGRMTATEVCEAFCKFEVVLLLFYIAITKRRLADLRWQRAAIAHQLTRCLTEPLFDVALKRASRLDACFKQTGKPCGPLHGLPISVKDTFDIEGVDSTTGLTTLAFKPAEKNAPLVDLLHSLGAVIITKTNIPQTLGALDSANNIFGRTLNPLNRKLTAGGSSGGEGVLIAMRGSMVGIGTDIGGSIRIPAMCNGVYGFKPSSGRVPYGGQESGGIPGRGRSSIQAVAGPIARSMSDINILMKEIVPRSELWGEDCIPGKWASETPALEENSPRKFTIGILRSDGRIPPLPPIAKVLNEVAEQLRRVEFVEIVEVLVPKALGDCQAMANALMAVDGGNFMMDLLKSTGEPLIPWLQNRVRRGKPRTLSQLFELQAKRAEIERAMMQMWTVGSDKSRKIDAIIHPVAPHPVPEIDRYNAVGYTSSWVLLDYPAGSIPVRNFAVADLELGKEIDSIFLSSWDKRNRELWNSNTVDRRVYLNSPLSIQVLTPKLHDYDLYHAMDLIDRVLHGSQTASAKL
ncbi:hypothetical protein PRK78_000165 [Emydomyces testavorans]|uniref:amidase n=1 Tax=Emydomyces testavorans TaxID=2070801 RepID=A0AAF0DAT1_9EURO|nr:hypothetical protein PRK78_000165 [Emydomyces testavorans]